MSIERPGLAIVALKKAWEIVVAGITASITSWVAQVCSGLGVVFITVINSVPRFENELGKVWPLSPSSWVALGLTILLAAGVCFYAWLRQKQRRLEQRQTMIEESRRKRKKFNELELPPIPRGSKNVIMASLRDPKFLYAFIGASTLYVLAMVAIVLFTSTAFAVEVKVWPKNGESAAKAAVALFKNNEPLSTEVLGPDGCSQVPHHLRNGEVDAIVFKTKGTSLLWSRASANLSKSNRTVEVVSFPEHKHPFVEVPPILFRKNTAEFRPDNSNALLEAQQKLINHQGPILVLGRTCDEEFPPGSSLTNFELSKMRCEAAVKHMQAIMPRTQFVVVPLEHQFPLSSDPPSDETRPVERSVTFIPLSE